MEANVPGVDEPQARLLKVSLLPVRTMPPNAAEFCKLKNKDIVCAKSTLLMLPLALPLGWMGTFGQLVEQSYVAVVANPIQAPVGVEILVEPKTFGVLPPGNMMKILGLEPARSVVFNVKLLFPAPKVLFDPPSAAVIIWMAVLLLQSLPPTLP